MVDVDKLLNTTSAGALAKKLDAKDGTNDGKISGSIWNQFVQNNGVGTKISDTGSISIVNAMKSITTYVVREKNAKNEAEAEVVARFNKTADELDATTPTGSSNAPTQSEGTENPENTNPTGTVNAPNKTETNTSKPVEQTTNQAQIQKDYNSVKVKLPVRYSSKAVKEILKNREEGRNISQSLAKGSTKGITPENVAYALSNGVNFGEGRREAAKVVFEKLRDRMKALGLFVKGQHYYGSWNSFSQLSYNQQNALLRKYRNKIIEKENEIIEKDTIAKNNFNQNVRPNMQKIFNNATHFMAEVANMEPKPKIASGMIANKKNDTARLPDGRWITVEYDSNNKITEISIGYNKTSDGTADDTDVYFTKEEAGCDCANSGRFEDKITSGYDFEALKVLAEKIFGKPSAQE